MTCYKTQVWMHVPPKAKNTPSATTLMLLIPFLGFLSLSHELFLASCAQRWAGKAGTRQNGRNWEELKDQGSSEHTDLSLFLSAAPFQFLCHTNAGKIRRSKTWGKKQWAVRKVLRGSEARSMALTVTEGSAGIQIGENYKEKGFLLIRQQENVVWRQTTATYL